MPVTPLSYGNLQQLPPALKTLLYVACSSLSLTDKKREKKREIVRERWKGEERGRVGRDWV